jgi:sulfite reductase (NADPH) flavoprotein alpha-component
MTSEVASPVIYSRKNPFPATMEVNRKLSLEGSEKDTRHLEISLAGSGLAYECGDSLGVFPRNCDELVEEIIRVLHATGDEPVLGTDGASKSLREALASDYVITQPQRKFIQAVSERAGEAAPLLADLLQTEKKKELEEYLWGMECIDFLLEHPSVKFSPAEFVGLLRKLQPRLYSIASSQKAYPDSVHLTVATVRYKSHGRLRKGVASTYLAERAGDGPIPVFVHVAKGFRLPEDPSIPIIMVGPGTGIAPFRAFLQERQVTGASGSNWLFFGEQRQKSDFLYREEFEEFQANGVLTKFHTAFSRDQAHKIYVQDRLLENGKDVWKWLEQGAQFFVCGDALRMAKDVDAALHKIIEVHGGKAPEEAAAFVEGLKKSKRYKRDVY